MNNITPMRPRMRTLPRAAEMLRELDPGCAVTLTALRRMVKRGEIPTIEAGSKRLVNFDALLEHLAAPLTPRQELPMAGTVRRVEL